MALRQIESPTRLEKLSSPWLLSLCDLSSRSARDPLVSARGEKVHRFERAEFVRGYGASCRSLVSWPNTHTHTHTHTHSIRDDCQQVSRSPRIAHYFYRYYHVSSLGLHDRTRSCRVWPNRNWIKFYGTLRISSFVRLQCYRQDTRICLFAIYLIMLVQILFIHSFIYLFIYLFHWSNWSCCRHIRKFYKSSAI